MSALRRWYRTARKRRAVVRRARVVLVAALGSTNLEIARQVPIDEETVGLWRRRWTALQMVPLDDLSVAERLADAPRPGQRRRLSPEQVCQIVALVCEQPSGSGRPISHWSRTCPAPGCQIAPWRGGFAVRRNGR